MIVELRLFFHLQEQHPLGCIQVGGHSVHPLPEEVDSEGASGHYAFTLVRGGAPTLTLAAHSPLARHQWGQFLTQAAAWAAQVSLMHTHTN